MFEEMRQKLKDDVSTDTPEAEKVMQQRHQQNSQYLTAMRLLGKLAPAPNLTLGLA